MRGRLFLLGALLPLALSACEQQPSAVPATVVADVEYLTQLGLMRGHLLVGHELLAVGEEAAAQTHAKHPSDELYASVQPLFAQRGAVGFATALEAHAEAVGSGDLAKVETAYAALLEAIGRSEEVVEASPGLTARVIVSLLREAAVEYAVGIVDGRLENAHEFQDAYGFANVALNMARRHHATTATTDANRRLFEQIASRIAELADMWPSLMPPEQLAQDATRLRAAADIERLAGRIELPGRLD